MFYIMHLIGFGKFLSTGTVFELYSSITAKALQKFNMHVA